MRFEKASGKARPIYRIREVDGQDDDVADTLADLHRLTFFDGASIPEFDGGRWWLVFFEAMPMEARAKHNGWSWVVSDTTDNLTSANNFIRAGYRLYQPQYPWGWPNTLYWRKSLTCSRPHGKLG